MAPVYATPTQLAEWMGQDDPPEGAERALRDASLDVDALLIGAVYTVNAEQKPTDERIARVLADATCRQAAFGSGQGDTTKAQKHKTVKIDQISYTAATDPATGRVIVDHYDPRVLATLAVEGLIPNHPRTAL